MSLPSLNKVQLQNTQTQAHGCVFLYRFMSLWVPRSFSNRLLTQDQTIPSCPDSWQWSKNVLYYRISTLMFQDINPGAFLKILLIFFNYFFSPTLPWLLMLSAKQCGFGPPTKPLISVTSRGLSQEVKPSSAPHSCLLSPGSFIFQHQWVSLSFKSEIKSSLVSSSLFYASIHHTYNNILLYTTQSHSSFKLNSYIFLTLFLLWGWGSLNLLSMLLLTEYMHVSIPSLHFQTIYSRLSAFEAVGTLKKLFNTCLW